MADFWTSDPTYLAYTAARWRRDTVQAAALVRSGIESSQPRERALWLAAQASMLAELMQAPGHFERAWDCVEQALSAAGDSYELRRYIFKVLFAMLVYEGPGRRFRGVLQQLQPDLRRLLREPAISYNVSTVRFNAGCWRQALLWLNRALAAGFVSSGGAAGQAVVIAYRARINARLGQLDKAKADVAEANLLFERYGEGHPRHVMLAVAEAEVALRAGRLQEARTLMQQHMAQPESGAAFIIIQFRTLAAELALAEGNDAGYRHYAELALDACREHGLNLTVHYVQAVLAEAEQRYGGKPRSGAC